MKLRKITSLLISATMAFSAFATLASAESANATVAVSQVAEATANTYAQRFTGANVPDGYGVFTIAISLNDLGAFDFTLVEDDLLGNSYEGQMFTGIDIDLKAANLTYFTVVAKSSAIPSVAGGALKTGDGINFAVVAGDPSAALPKASTKVDNYSIPNAITAVVMAPLGTEVKATQARYATNGASGTNFTGTDVFHPFTVAPFTLGEKQEAKKALGLTIDGTDAKKENGYIWKLGLTQENGAKADSFTADFKDSEGLTNTKTARNSVADFFGGAGTVEFYVGLKTARTIKEFKATVADSTAEGVTASATWTAE